MKKHILLKIALFIISLYSLILTFIHYSSLRIISQCDSTVGIKANAIFFSSLERELMPRLKASLKDDKTNIREKIFLLGGARPQHHRYGSETMAKVLKTNGVDENKLITERVSFDTFSNLQSLIHLNSQNLATLLISDRYHLSRIAVILEQAPPQFSYNFCISANNDTIVQKLSRLHYELIAWSLMLLPNDSREFLVKKVRHSYE